MMKGFKRRKLYTVKNGNNNFINEVILAGLLKIIV